MLPSPEGIGDFGAPVEDAADGAWQLSRGGAVTSGRGDEETEALGLLDREERARQYALWFVRMRWIAAGIVAVSTAVAVPIAGILPRSAFVPLVAWLAALVGANLAFGRWARRGADPERQIVVQSLVDLTILTGLLNVSGGLENPLYIAYLFHAIIGSMLLPRRRAVWVTAGACALFTLLAVGEYAGLFGHQTNVLFPHGPRAAHAAAGAALEHSAHDPVFVAGRVLPFLAVLILTSYLTQLVASRLQRSEERLVRTAREVLLERRRLESVVHAAGLGMVLYDPDRTVRWCNRRAREWLAGAGDGNGSASAEEGGGAGDGLRGHGLAACLAEGRPGEIERSLLRPSGALRYLRHAFSPLVDQEGRVVQAVELIEDVTARKALEAEALHAGKLAVIGQMAAGVAHEIGNPLASLETRLQLIRRRHDPELLTESLDVLHGQIERIGRIVRGVSEFARIRGQEWTEWELAPVIDEALSMAHLDPRAKAVRFETVMPETSLRVRGVRDQFVQVVLNLLLNAVQAMPDGGEVRIEGARQGGATLLSVSDTGVGMDEAVRRRLFEPFFTTRQEGTGLGLAVSYSLVHAHGGRIEVESARGRGSRFTLVLPQEGAG